MRNPSEVRPINYHKANSALQDLAPTNKNQEALALLKTLMLGEQDVAAGKIKPVGEVVTRLRAKRTRA